MPQVAAKEIRVQQALDDAHREARRARTLLGHEQVAHARSVREAAVKHRDQQREITRLMAENQRLRSEAARQAEAAEWMGADSLDVRRALEDAAVRRAS